MNFIGVIAGKSGAAITKEVHKWGWKVAIVSGNDREPGVDLAEAKCCTDLSNIDEILTFFKEYSVDKVVLGTGHILAIKLAEVLEQNGVLINISPKVSALCNNKYELKKVIEEIGLKTPRYFEIAKGEEISGKAGILGFPLVVKSICDYVPPQLVHDFEQLDSALEELFDKEPTVMLEQYVNGNDCSVVISNDGTEIQSISVLYWSKAKEDHLKGFFESFSEPLEKTVEDQVKRDAEKLIGHINVLGLPRVDIIVQEGIPYILEINSIVFSRNSGTWYTISSRKNGVYTPNIIVGNAMKYFSEQTGETFTRHNRKMVFADENDVRAVHDQYSDIIYGTPELEEGYLYPDVIAKIREFVEQSGVRLDEAERMALNSFIGYINKENPDEVINYFEGRQKILVQLAKAFLNRD